MSSDTLNGVRDQRDQGPPTPGTPITTMDGTPGGAVAQNGIEIDEGTSAPVAPAAPIAPAEPELTEREIKTKIANKRFKDDARSAIFERRNAMSLEERQELENSDGESLAILEAHAGHQREGVVSTAPLAPREPAVPAAPAAPAAAPGAPAPQAPVATNSNRYKLSIYGQEQEVGEDEIIQAGIQALQKQHAADARMRDAATYEARLNKWAQDLQAFADQKAQEEARTASSRIQPGTAGNPAPTSTGVAAVVDPATMRAAMEAMENLDTAKATELMQKAINDAVVAGRSAAPAPSPATSPQATGGVPRLPPAPADIWSDDQRASANKVFNSEFAHFTDAQFNAAKAAVDEAMADPANAGQSLATIVRNVCRTTQRFMPAGAAPAPAQVPVNPTAEELARRQVLKARIPVTPPAASLRAATPAAPEFRGQSPADYVQQLRRRSGSNSTR
jgi:hypothetical protein